MPRKFFRKYLPDADAVRASRLGKAFGGWLDHPDLWRLNRRSVSGAVAIGLAAGLVPGPLQMLVALVLSVFLKRNIPVALVATLYTNPLTIVPLYLLAYWLGTLLLGVDHVAPKIALLDWELLASLGKPLAMGLLALALALSVLGYAAVQIGWRLYVIAAWKRRGRR